VKEFIVFGDYKNSIDIRADFKIFDFVLAETAEQAFKRWKQSLNLEDPHVLDRLEENVYIIETGKVRWVFDLDSESLIQKYSRKS